MYSLFLGKSLNHPTVNLTKEFSEVANQVKSTKYSEYCKLPPEHEARID